MCSVMRTKCSSFYQNARKTLGSLSSAWKLWIHLDEKLGTSAGFKMLVPEVEKTTITCSTKIRNISKYHYLLNKLLRQRFWAKHVEKITMQDSCLNVKSTENLQHLALTSRMNSWRNWTINECSSTTLTASTARNAFYKNKMIENKPAA